MLTKAMSLLSGHTTWRMAHTLYLVKQEPGLSLIIFQADFNFFTLLGLEDVPDLDWCFSTLVLVMFWDG